MARERPELAKFDVSSLVRIFLPKSPRPGGPTFPYREIKVFLERGEESRRY